MAAAAAYEAKRRRQIEENKRRIEELGLRQLAAAAIPPQVGSASLKIMKKRVIGMTAVERSYAIAKAKAKELECELGADYPTFVRTITHYTTTLSLPLQFCREHLPEHVKVITLVDDEFDVQCYKAPRYCKYCMTGNWKWFAINHKLDYGDCRVFQLIHQTKFKVRS
nr:unnamed protein product [Digitaria exilis]